MLNVSTDPVQGVTLPGIDAHLSMGWLLTPEAFARECLATRQRPHYDSWALSAHMPDAFVRTMESPLVPNSGGLSLVASKGGVFYPIVTLQTGGTQIRMLLSLADPTTQRWFRDVMAKGVLTVAFDVAERAQFAVTELPCAVHGEAEVDTFLGGETRMSRQELVLDAARVAKRMADRQALPSLIEGFETEHVRLVLAFDSLSGWDAEQSVPAERVLN